MRNLFSGHRQAAPPGPPQEAPPEVPAAETLQAVRLRQKHKQRQYIMQMLRAEKDRAMAESASQRDVAAAAEAKRRHMSDAAEALASQIVIFERIMEEFGLNIEMDDERRESEAALEASREAYHRSTAEADEALRETSMNHEYVNAMTSPFMMPSDVFDEDEAMRDLDETAKLTGRAE